MDAAVGAEARVPMAITLSLILIWQCWHSSIPAHPLMLVVHNEKGDEKSD